MLNREINQQFVQHREKFVRIALRYLEQDDAEDAVQNAFLKATEAQEKGGAAFRGEAALKTWLTSIVANECQQILRKKKGRIEGAASLDQQMGEADNTRILEERISADMPSLEDIVLGPLMMSELWQMIMRCAAGKWERKDYELFVLRTLTSRVRVNSVMTYEEIGELMEMPANSLRTRWRDRIVPVYRRAIELGQPDAPKPSNAKRR